MLKGFRDFLVRGNVIDLAVAVVIGTAFTALVEVVTTALLQPVINIFLGGGLTGGQVTVRGQMFDFGKVITAVLTFIIIAAVVYFAVVLPMRLINEHIGPKPPTKEPDRETVLLEQIRDLLKQQAPSH